MDTTSVIFQCNVRKEATLSSIFLLKKLKSPLLNKLHVVINLLIFYSENRIKELEGALKEKEADVNSLNEQLAAAKRTTSDLSEVSQSIEKQLADVSEQFEEYKKESEKTYVF